MRSTTENVPAIIGFAKALELAFSMRQKEIKRLTDIREYFIDKILNLDSKRVILNGDRKMRLPNNVNVSILGIDPEFTVLRLDALNISCSTKSSCLKDEKESYVVNAISQDSKRASSTLRFTMGRETTKKEIDSLLSHLKKII